jgi:hypothetical protein
MKQTAKYKAALKVAPNVLEPAELGRVRHENAPLYDALEKRGWFWSADEGQWSDAKQSNSMFADDAGLPTGVVRLRLMAHPGDMDQVMELVAKGLDSQGVTTIETSNVYPNRRGAGLRVYLTCKLPAKLGRKRGKS